MFKLPRCHRFISGGEGAALFGAHEVHVSNVEEDGHGRRTVHPPDRTLHRIPGVSHFVPHSSQYDDVHTSFAGFHGYVCKLTISDLVLPEGLGFQVEHLTKGPCALHISIFPTDVMLEDEFSEKLSSIYAPGLCDLKETYRAHGGPAGDDSAEQRVGRCWRFSPCQPGDALLIRASNVLYEHAQDPQTEPNFALRCLCLHHLMADHPPSKDLYTGDALSIHLGVALARCQDSKSWDEVVRDELRGHLENALADYHHRVSQLSARRGGRGGHGQK